MGVAGLYFRTSIFFPIMDRRGLRDPICVRRMQWLLHIRSARKPPIGGPMGGKLRLSTGTAGRQRYLYIRPVQSRRRRQFGCPRTIEWRGQAQRFFLDGGTDAHGLRQHRQIACIATMRHLRTSSKKRFMCWIWTLRLTSLVRFARLHMAVNARNAPVPS